VNLAVSSCTPGRKPRIIRDKLRGFASAAAGG
jgi:hypothetical protein